jgi:predicted signal transduction protein with EAL and GGDEF domain
MPSQLDVSNIDLTGKMKPFALTVFWISIAIALIASMMVSYQLEGHVSFAGIKLAQTTNPALWFLDALPFAIVFWGKSFCKKLTMNAASIIDDNTQELRNLNSNLTLQLKYESNFDSVTKLPNQTQLIQKINQSIEQTGENELIALILLTIKGFKELNYNFGNNNASAIVKQFAEKLKKLLVLPFMLDAKMGMGFLAHIQGNQFTLLIPSIQKDVDIEALLQQIIASTKTECTIDGNQITITPLASAVLYPIHGDSADILLHRANVVSFYTKKEDKGYAIYLPSMEDSLVVDRTMLEDLKTAIDNDDLEIYYQPNIELSTGKIIGAEALIRFNNPEFGLLNADKLIPLVEGMNLMKQLTTLVLKGVVKQIAEWRSSGYNLSVSINLSAADVIDVELPKQIQLLLEEYQLPAEVLKVELTERACLKDQTKTLAVLKDLEKIGIKISIEDFCGGFTGFQYIMNFPISEVKIDKSFVLPMMTDNNKRKMVTAIVKLAKIMGMDVFAVGVENKAIVDELQAIGCLYGQGFYFSKAVNVADFTKLLSEDPNTSLLNVTRSEADSLPI